MAKCERCNDEWIGSDHMVFVPAMNGHLCTSCASHEIERLRQIDDAIAKARLYLSVPCNPDGVGSLPEDDHTLTIYTSSFDESQELACLLLPDCTAPALTML